MRTCHRLFLTSTLLFAFAHHVEAHVIETLEENSKRQVNHAQSLLTKVREAEGERAQLEQVQGATNFVSPLPKEVDLARLAPELFNLLNEATLSDKVKAAIVEGLARLPLETTTDKREFFKKEVNKHIAHLIKLATSPDSSEALRSSLQELLRSVTSTTVLASHYADLLAQKKPSTIYALSALADLGRAGAPHLEEILSAFQWALAQKPSLKGSNLTHAMIAEAGARALGAIGPKAQKAVSDLTELLNRKTSESEWNYARASAAKALYQIDPKGSISPLINSLVPQGAQTQTQEAAVEALEKAYSQGLLEGHEKDVTTKLRTLFSHTDPALANAAARLLVKTSEKSSPETTVALFERELKAPIEIDPKDPEPPTQKLWAAKFLGQAAKNLPTDHEKRKSATKLLEDLLTDEDSTLQKFALRSLRDLKAMSPELKQKFEALMKGPKIEVALEAAHCLLELFPTSHGTIPHEIEKKLLEGLSEAQHRSQALDILLSIHPKKITNAFMFDSLKSATAHTLDPSSSDGQRVGKYFYEVLQTRKNLEYLASFPETALLSLIRQTEKEEAIEKTFQFLANDSQGFENEKVKRAFYKLIEKRGMRLPEIHRLLAHHFSLHSKSDFGLVHEDAQTLLNMLFALGPRGEKALQKQFIKTDEVLLKLLLRMGEPGTKFALSALKSPGDEQKAAAIEMLEIGKITPPHEWKDSLFEYTMNANESAAEGAAAALGRMAVKDPELVKTLASQLNKKIGSKSRVAPAFAEMGDLAVSPLQEALKSKDVETQDGALQAFAELPGKVAKALIPDVTTMLEDKTSKNKVLLLKSLSRLKRQEETVLSALVPPLISLMASDKEEVRSHAIAQLNHLAPRDERSLPHLVQTAKNDSEMPVSFAVVSLIEMGEPGQAQFGKLLKTVSKERKDLFLQTLLDTEPNSNLTLTDELLSVVSETAKDHEHSIGHAARMFLGKYQKTHP
jgi:hypothetical protein